LICLGSACAATTPQAQVHSKAEILIPLDTADNGESFMQGLRQW
jgi:hypothetical protein